MRHALVPTVRVLNIPALTSARVPPRAFPIQTHQVTRPRTPPSVSGRHTGRWIRWSRLIGGAAHHAVGSGVVQGKSGPAGALVWSCALAVRAASGAFGHADAALFSVAVVAVASVWGYAGPSDAASGAEVLAVACSWVLRGAKSREKSCG